MGRCPVCQRSQSLSVLIQCQRAPSLSVSRELRFLALSLIDNVLIFAWRPVYRVCLLINFNAVHLQIIKSERFTLIFNSRKSKHALFPYLEMLQWSLKHSDHACLYLWHTLYLVAKMPQYSMHSHFPLLKIRKLTSSNWNAYSYPREVCLEFFPLSIERVYCRSICSRRLAGRMGVRSSPHVRSDQVCRDHGIAWPCEATASILLGWEQQFSTVDYSLCKNSSWSNN
jgi:hypothetical protein